ncbi:hypothetical protein GUJ93_ZPchr0013g37098 [Zizania palustris]|uniref:Uncharacterized protein n=1 Tax=Zizania palustris TaxID=103762 RepID=A0A8J5X151_ZIZPA|nr:hypothetical protein GUJ93_ZPchr0013g37098 [Zizania palustris]
MSFMFLSRRSASAPGRSSRGTTRSWRASPAASGCSWREMALMRTPDRAISPATARTSPTTAALETLYVGRDTPPSTPATCARRAVLDPGKHRLGVDRHHTVEV